MRATTRSSDEPIMALPLVALRAMAPRGRGHDGDPAAHILMDVNPDPPGRYRIDDVVGNSFSERLTKRAFITIRPQIVLERLGLDALLAGLVFDLDRAKV